MKSVDVLCQQEEKVIGKMQLPAAGRKVDSDWIWLNYQPVSQEYVLPQVRAKNGAYFLCPYCFGKLELVSGDVEQISTERALRDGPRAPAVSRASIRAKVVSDLSGSFHEHVSSDAKGPAGRPLVLGALRVRK